MSAGHSYAYDQANRLTTVDGVSTYGYNGANAPTKVPAASTQNFDAAGQLTTSNASPGAGTTYTYDVRGNRQVTAPSNGYWTTNSFDLANRTTKTYRNASSETSYPAQVNLDSPGAYYRLNDASGSGIWNTTHTQQATTSGNVHFQNGSGMIDQDLNGAIGFDPNSAEAWFPTVPSNTTTGGDTTVEFFMRWGGNSTGIQVPFAFGSNYMLAFNNGNFGFTTHANASDIYGVSATPLSQKWVHVAAVFRNGSVTGSKLYIDGVAQTLTQRQGTPTALNASTSATLSGNVAGSYHYDGGIDELAIYNSALSQTRVSAHFAAISSTNATYSYNGDGLRTTKVTDGKTIPFTWDPSQSLPNLTSDGTNFYIYGPDGLPLEQVTTGGVAQWFGHDAQGNTSFLADAWAYIGAGCAYDAYGNVTASRGQFDTPLLYQGQYRDVETGFMYLRARYYDPATAQFLSVDPLATTTRSRYGYVNNNPMNGSDPSGLCFWVGCQLGQTTIGRGVTDFAGGVVNGISFGHGQQILSAVGEDGFVNPCSAVYGAGTGVGLALDAPFLRGAGAGDVVATGNVTRVGRWMSSAEHDAMIASGRVQEGAGGVTSVASPASLSSYERQAAAGSRYIEFDVPTGALSVGGRSDWAVIRGPNSALAKFGRALDEMPTATNVEWIASRLR